MGQWLCAGGLRGGRWKTVVKSARGEQRRGDEEGKIWWDRKWCRVICCRTRVRRPSDLSILQAYEAERSKVRAKLVEILPETGAKSEVIASFMEGRLSAAALSIEGKLALEMEDERAQMREAAKVRNQHLSANPMS